jgi:ABC-type transport system involved in cytochrome bd biosynthesis fused ATPase/permease subunit
VGNVVEIQDVTKTYKRDDFDVKVLSGLSFQVEEGDFVALMGPSGSGKTILATQFIAEGIARGVSMVFLVALPMVVIAFGLAWLLQEVPLRDDVNLQAASVEGLEEAGAV